MPLNVMSLCHCNRYSPKFQFFALKNEVIVLITAPIFVQLPIMLIYYCGPPHNRLQMITTFNIRCIISIFPKGALAIFSNVMFLPVRPDANCVDLGTTLDHHPLPQAGV
jgi:hypothetical protein